MKQVLTIVCKLNSSKEVVNKIDTTLEMFAAACNYANQTVKPTITSKTTIQSEVYQTIRSKYNLSANLAVRACARVGANRKTAKKDKKPVKKFKPTSADYDARIFAFREKDWTVSLTLVGGREHISIVTSNYQIGKLKGKKPTSAQLCKHGDGSYYIHIQVKDDAPKPIKADNVIGCDFGRTDLAVTSDNKKWSGREIRDVRDKYSKQRANLQKKASKGTRSSRRRCRALLKRLSGKEKRFQRHINHVISKTIVLSAKKSNSIIATFLEYKGLINGVEILPVSPRYSSQTCHSCLYIGLRSGKKFKCTNADCCWSGDSDFNASLVLSIIGASVSKLRGSEILSCELMRSGIPWDIRFGNELCSKDRWSY